MHHADPDQAVAARVAALLTTLTSATDGDVVARAVAHGALAAPLPAAVLVAESVDDGSRLLCRGICGAAPASPPGVPPAPGPPGYLAEEAFRAGHDIWTARESDAAPTSLPGHRSGGARESNDALIAALLLRHQGVPVGVMALYLPPAARPSAELLECVRGAVALWLTSSRDSRSRRQLPVAGTLTPRQQSLLALAADGRTNGQIARQLGYAEGTIRADLTALYRLLGARDRGELIDVARSRGLFQGPATRRGPDPNPSARPPQP